MSVRSPSEAGCTLKRLDRALGPIAALVGRALGALPGAREDPRPLVVRPGGMGDLICAQIALESLGRDPRSFLWLIERRSEAWAALQGLPHLLYDAGIARSLLLVRGRHRLVFNTEQLFGLSQAFALAARRRGGRVVAFDTNRGAGSADARVAYDPLHSHEAVEFARLFSEGGSGPASPAPRPRLSPSDGTIVVGLGGLQSPTRRLPLETWVSLVRGWTGGDDWVLLSSPQDREFGEALLAKVGKGVLASGGFEGACRILRAAEKLLAMDSGMVHIASYYGIPTTALFTSGRSGKWAPLGVGSSVRKAQGLDCQPCTLFGQTPRCEREHACQRVFGTGGGGTT